MTGSAKNRTQESLLVCRVVDNENTHRRVKPACIANDYVNAFIGTWSQYSRENGVRKGNQKFANLLQLGSDELADLLAIDGLACQACHDGFHHRS